jgi:hypothetical protein
MKDVVSKKDHEAQKNRSHYAAEEHRAIIRGAPSSSPRDRNNGLGRSEEQSRPGENECDESHNGCESQELIVMPPDEERHERKKRENDQCRANPGSN